MLIIIISGSIYLWWMAWMFIVYTYNALSIPLRASFPQAQGTNFTPLGTLQGPPFIENVGLLIAWIVIDVLMDMMFLLDSLFFRSHVLPSDNSVRDFNVTYNRLSMYFIVFLVSVYLLPLY